MKFSVISSLLAAAPGIMAMPTSTSSETTSELVSRQSANTKMLKTNDLMWSYSMTTFLSRRKSKNPSYLIWTSDGCTKSPDKPFGWSFVKACYRHDFGYRNYKKQSRFNTTNKKRIDNKFRDDLYNVCDAEASNYTRRQCKVLADEYYHIMKAFTKRQEAGDVDVGVEIDETDEVVDEAIANAIKTVEQEFVTMGVSVAAGQHLSGLTVEEYETALGLPGLDVELPDYQE